MHHESNRNHFLNLLKESDHRLVHQFFLAELIIISI